jgi:hypothetical protein
LSSFPIETIKDVRGNEYAINSHQLLLGNRILLGARDEVEFRGGKKDIKVCGMKIEATLGGECLNSRGERLVEGSKGKQATTAALM